MIERIDTTTPAAQRWGHEARYRLAVGYCLPGDSVLDAACGIGYGAALLDAHDDIDYLGIDCADVVDPTFDQYGEFRVADLDDAETFVGLDVDVAVTFETIEHLADPAMFLTRLCHVTRHTIVASVPTVPTKARNPYHLHDFDEDHLPALVEQVGGWTLIQHLRQPSELSSVYVWQRGA